MKMTFLKKMTLVVLLFVGIQTSSSAQFTIGGGAIYSFNGSDFGLQAKGLIGVGEKLDLSPSASVFLGNGTPWALDFDLQYELFEIGNGFRFLPFAGLNFVNSDDFDLGLNIGASIRFDVNENTVYIEPKLTLLTYEGVALSAGMLF